MKEFNGNFDNINQRVAFSFLKFLVPFNPCVPDGLAANEQSAMEASQRDLYSFFQKLYEQLYTDPAAFGLPLTADDELIDDEPEMKERKQVVKRKMDKPRKTIQNLLNFLMRAGATGTLEDSTLRVTPDESMAKLLRSRNMQKCLNGLEKSGLHIAEQDTMLHLTHDQFCAMIPALQALASACAIHPDQKMGFFNFSRCDFLALTRADYVPEATDLYPFFNEDDQERLSELHHYFTQLGYNTTVQVGMNNEIVIKYQGNRKIKSSPLFQVEFQDRYLFPLRIYIKNASVSRIADLIPDQPQFLQEDFFTHRAINCMGDKCGWCRNKKTLGPSVMDYQGETRTLCWFTWSEVTPFVNSSVDLIKQYAQMHEQLALAS